MAARTAEPGVILLDDRRIFVAANEPAATLLATTTEQLIGRRADEFMPLVARRLYPLAWKGFLVRRVASGEYAAQRPDGSLAHLAYVGFANRPIRGLHFFVLEPLGGSVEASVLVPRMQKDYIQVGTALPDEQRQRLIAEADREEWRLPIARGGQAAVLAALFDQPASALDALQTIRGLKSVEASVASAAGATPDTPLTVLAGRVPFASLGEAVESIHSRGGRIITTVDERLVRREQPPPAGSASSRPLSA